MLRVRVIAVYSRARAAGQWPAAQGRREVRVEYLDPAKERVPWLGDDQTNRFRALAALSSVLDLRQSGTAYTSDGLANGAPTKQLRYWVPVDANMVAWGAPATTEEAKTITDYLAANFGD